MPLSDADDLLHLPAAEPGRDLGGEPAVGGRGGGALVALERQPVLRLAGDPVLLGHLFGRLAHRLAGRRLGDRRRHRAGGRGAGSGRASPSRAPSVRALPASTRIWLKRAGVENRDVGQRFDAAGDDGVGVAERDLVGGVGDGLGRRRRRRGSGCRRGRWEGTAAGDSLRGRRWASSTEGTTWPKITSSTSRPSSSLR